jgi:putative oxidoreductase
MSIRRVRMSSGRTARPSEKESAVPTDLVFLFGRVLLGGAFFVAGLRNFVNRERLITLMASRKVPNARPVTLFGFAVQTLCGFLMMIGVLTPWAALGQAVFLIAATLIVHPYWTFPKAEQSPHVGAMLVNTGLVGAFLMLAAVTF